MGASGLSHSSAAPPPPSAAAHECPRPRLPPCSKIFVSLLAGVFTGIVGITGYKGFLIYLLAHALMAGLLMLKASLQPQRYFVPG